MEKCKNQDDQVNFQVIEVNQTIRQYLVADH